MKINFLNNRRFKHGSLATIITIGFVALVVLINVIAGLLLDRFPLSIDLTTDKRFALTQDSIDFVKKVDEKVTITVCSEEQDLTGSSELYKQVAEIIKSYPKYSSNITVDFLSLVSNPNFAKQHPEETFSSGDIYIQSSLRGKKISVSDMIESSESQQTGQVSYRSRAEQKMTSAVDYVTDKSPKKAVLLTGLSNIDVSGYTGVLEPNNYIVAESNFLTEEIDQAADFVIFPQPITDLTTEQATKLEKYLDNDSKFGKSLVFIASQDQAPGPILKAFLAEWGMEIGSGTIAETDPSHAYSGSPFFILNEIVDEDLSTALNTNQPTVTVMTRPINVLFQGKDNRSTTVLAKSYDTAVIYPEDQPQDFDLNAQEKGSFNTVVMGSRMRYEGTVPMSSKVIAISSESMLSNELVTYPGFANGSVALAMTGLIAPKEESINIIPLEFSADTITINEGQILVNRIIFVFIIPIALAVAGLVIWLRRRHL